MSRLSRLMAEIQYRICLVDCYLAQLRGEKVAAAEAYQDACRIKADWELDELQGDMK